jgi:transposase
MAVADAAGLPVAVCLASASPHEVKLAETALDSLFISGMPEKLIGDKAYDSDTLDDDLLKKQGVEMIAPHRRNRKKPKTQDGRKLRRHKRRWKVERLFAWLQNFRRLVVRYERHADNFLAFLLLACSIILLRSF